MSHEYRPPQARSRLTRRGRLALFLGVLLAIGAAVLTPVLRGGQGPEEPRQLVIPEGWRATQVYSAVDRALKLPPGSAKSAVATAALALPAEAKGNPEGYLFPATYPVTSKTTPAALLAHMVRTADEKLATKAVADGGRAHGMTPYQTATMASIIEAEAGTRADMGKVARVVHNRLAKSMPLQMDSTINYALNRSTVDTTLSDTRIGSPFNTYERQGLPPTPIGSPGLEAMAAAVAPTPGDWLYFVTVKPGDTRFSATYGEHRKHVAEFNRHRAAHAGPRSG
ncbi:aminodeoxychorismate lyase [Streptomyces sp. WM6373]|uniref:endolytic transglycosylase MltG n=1 Tax=Streptomyces TaxID=1883 RepID=UPI0004C64675|nr:MULTISPECIES: endolytic transglycosylase MltG [unclassified Streptomyces]KJY19324.1 aminodeoxychorismate lyase [Streptomyces sp. NRRL S-104]KOU41331.1 aminodeoxychorismate lyase [Streptomyces sp. WM6373]KOU78840.1 aminodeoxychorismate lyase [Streptomyces sp. XY58]KOV01190.1 aminodeoxychorismate lyase [Streptomyces sp. XY37]KOV14920.1 aminodeoxychorismate lyase [Streptomyces sp. XY413]